MKTQYESFYTVGDAERRVKYLTALGYKAYYQTKNSCNYEVRYWLQCLKLSIRGLCHHWGASLQCTTSTTMAFVNPCVRTPLVNQRGKYNGC